MRITIDGKTLNWEEVNKEEADKHRHLQRQLATYDARIQEERQIILDQISACVQRTRDKYRSSNS